MMELEEIHLLSGTIAEIRPNDIDSFRMRQKNDLTPDNSRLMAYERKLGVVHVTEFFFSCRSGNDVSNACVDPHESVF